MRRLFLVGAITREKSFWVFAAGVMLFVAVQAQPVEAAHCFCRFTASPQHGMGYKVLELSKDGYIQGVQKGKCKDYCKGQWDARDKVQLAKSHPNACGVMRVEVVAWIGTAPAELVNTANINVGGVQEELCICSAWPASWLSADKKHCQIGAGCRVAGIPDQNLQGGYFFWKGDLYRNVGTPNCKWDCKR